MATYKVIQDIEAEDHILGPLSLRQFIYALIAIMCIYFAYLTVAKGLAAISPIFILPALFAGFFAVPWSREQSTEVWAVAKIRFLFKPRRRIWDQSGMKQLVTITAPKHVEEQRTDGLTPTEVNSRLTALANTIDSRGWAIKNANVNLYGQPGQLQTGQTSDRLIDPGSIPQEVPSYDVQASDDILDERNNPVAQQFDQMIAASAQTHRQQIVNMLNAPAGQVPAAAPSGSPVAAVPSPALAAGVQPPTDYWFLNEPVAKPQLSANQAMFAKAQLVAPGTDNSQASDVHAAQPTAEEEALAQELKAQHGQPNATYAHMRNIQPLNMQQGSGAQTTPTLPPAAPASKQPPDADLVQLSRNNDLNVATLARQANKHDKSEGDDGEVVISLH